MRCIETDAVCNTIFPRNAINYNMRCIETCLIQKGIPFFIDKLQHEMYWNDTNVPHFLWRFEINYNMRCIETYKKLKTMLDKWEINYNMRCIETSCLLAVNNISCDKLQHEMYWNSRQRERKNRQKMINYYNKK